jgi:hypothetical protein
MPINKAEIMGLSAEEKRKLAFELLDSIDEEFAATEIPEWRLRIIRERLRLDKEQPNNVISWTELKKKYA